MELISYTEFAKLRLATLSEAEVVQSESADWEWMGGLWHCDAIGFTWFGRLNDMSEETGALEVHFPGLSESDWMNILASISLPLRAGMTFEAIAKILGEPFQTFSFVADRKTYEFKVGSNCSYQVSCTIHNQDGLVFASVIRDDVLVSIERAQNEAE